MSKHTPEPWHCSVGEDEPAAETVAEVWPTGDDSDIADGHLIAAAPRLLAALKALATFSYTSRHDAGHDATAELHALWNEARAAITQAENGEATT